MTLSRKMSFWGMLLGLCLLVTPASATVVHNFDCKNCHRVGVSFTDLGQGTTNICLQCHKEGAGSIQMLDGTFRAPTGRFAPGDASNALGSYPDGLEPGAQTSHIWAASDVNPQAGAQAPSDRRFYGRYHISTGKITCQRCHDPHSRDPENTKILRLGAGSRDQMCIQCHAPWVVGSEDRGLLTHPTVEDYAAVVAAQPDKYRPIAEVEAWPGDIQLLDNGGVGCASCHGVHYADSSSETPVIPGQASIGDGKLLRGDGPQSAGTYPLCQACHTYKLHGSATEEVSCLVCHSGHSYNQGEINYFVLRSQTETQTYGAVGGLRYAALPDVHGGSSTIAAQWAGTPGSPDGFCERCHGEVTTMEGSARAHIAGENCLACHNHNAAGMEYSFGANCADCHGFPPSVNVAGGPDGYAYVEGGHDYAADPYSKDENLSAHTSHAGSGSGYGFTCNLCHNADDFAATHNQGSFQDVFLAGNSFDPLVTANGILSPSYDPSGAGTCSNLYCHSSGGKHNPSGKTASDFTTVSVSWGGGKGTITTCNACHGNDVDSMTGLNSSAHLKHLAAGYACNVCHVETAASATTLVAGARGGTHVNGLVDVVFDSDYNLGNALLGAATYNSVDGSCAVFCHSDGQGNFASPTWGDAASGACGSCHAVSGQDLSGSHGVHVAPLGANIGCAACHGAGADTGAHAGHVDGALTVDHETCNSCHGVESEEIILVWGNAESADCMTCHTGAQTTVYVDRDGVERSASAMSAYYAAGHGGVAAPQRCRDCHSTEFDADHMGADSTNRLRSIYGNDFNSDPQAFCNICHSFDAQLHYATTGTSHDASNCIACHDPHGQSGAQDAMIRDQIGGRQVVGFSDRSERSSYYLDLPNQGGNNQYGICQVCHESDAVSYYNRTEEAPDHFAGLCISCHMHDGEELAFTPTGCNGCHGGGNNDPPADNFWPDGELRIDYSIADRAGSHQPHVDAIGQAISGLSDAAWAAYDNKLSYQNLACAYCHPDPGGSNAEGGPHTTPVTGRNDLTADVHGDPWNEGTYFRDMNGDFDPTGFYNPVIQRCSNIACHSNGSFTWTWYEDAIAPGKITDLSATIGDRTGTALLSWTAPGNDDGTGPMAYQYQVRYSTSPINGEAAWNDAEIAGGPPSVLSPGWTQNMRVYGLEPGENYHFAVKTADESFNWSEVSNAVSSQASPDVTPPRFFGLEKAVPAHISGAVNLFWPIAVDDYSRVTYKVWWTDGSFNLHFNLGRTLPEMDTTYGSGDEEYTIWTDVTTGLGYQVGGLDDGKTYQFLVRAQDEAGNRDANIRAREAIPQMLSENEWRPRVLKAIASPTGRSIAGLTTNFGSCESKRSHSSGPWRSELTDGDWGCSSPKRKNEIEDIRNTNIIKTWIMPDPYVEDMNIQGGRFQIFVEERGDRNQRLRVELGYYTANGTTWHSLGHVDRDIRRKSKTMVRFSLVEIGGRIPAGGHLAVRLKKENLNADRDLRLRFGSQRFGSMLTVSEQVANDRPAPFTVTTPGGGGAVSGVIDIDWSEAVDPEGDPVTYDVYGSSDGGASFEHVIALNLAERSTKWDTALEGIGLDSPNTQVRIRVLATDGYAHNEDGTFHSHREAFSGIFTVDNSVDTTPPAAITDLRAEHRPKAGTVQLYWTAPGDDGDEGGRAARYDIRYKLADGDGPVDESTWASSTVLPAPPVPGDPGLTQGYEVVGLQPGTAYFFGIKTQDHAGNWSQVSNSPAAEGGLACGVCHGTPPDEPNRLGAHIGHGYTQVDCAKCHGEDSMHYGLDHMVGEIRMAWNNPRKGFFNTATGPTELTADKVVYHDGDVKIYEDLTGPGGFNDLTIEMQNIDSGTCFGFNATGVTGCHGSGEPMWNDPSTVTCAGCHGDPDRPNIDPYGRPFEDPTLDERYYGNRPIYQAAPPIDLLGNEDGDAVGQHLRHLNFSYRFTGHSCTLCHEGNDHADGTVDVRLNLRAAGRDAEWVPPTELEPGSCIGTSELRCHGSGAVDPTWTTRSPEPHGPRLVECNECHGHQGYVYWVGESTNSATVGRASTISGTQHGDGAINTLTVSSSGNNLQIGDRIRKNGTFFQITAKSGTTLTLHRPIPVGMRFSHGEQIRTKHIPHTSDGGQVRHCTWCHVEGHPQGGHDDGGETVFIPNYPMVGIDYSSGGIHLRRVINGRTHLDGQPITSEAEVCWACHQDNNISEWGVNQKANTGNMDYDYGSLNQARWVGAIWTSPNFSYKTGEIQSTHSVNPDVLGPGVDPVEMIRCSYCHDVHDLNLAPNDDVSGPPYLRGTWKGNPYKEDGAPGRYDRDGVNSAVHNWYDWDEDYGMVPRGSTTQNRMGGYWIDQNSGYPTADWTLDDSAGLCVMCHGRDVDNMNRFGDPADAWVGVNGHSNAVIGGSGVHAANVYNPAIRKEGYMSGDTRLYDWRRPAMGYQDTIGKDGDRIYGLRNDDGGSTKESSSHVTSRNRRGVYPYAWNSDRGENRYAVWEPSWGVDDSTTAPELGYHRFSCSKCHNPHASRLPRLMITNCLDVYHNTWDDVFANDRDWWEGEADGTSVAWNNQGVMPYSGTDARGVRVDRQFAYATSAQNCHRYVNISGSGEPEEPGWNRVTPWQ
ncbi:CxxxxCH/CxxCH domain-containing protein [Geoalkalibacter halelectricus]|uniref:CxxxxCH/CxxCH domain-containing protein n=1 Tax=Geoalkalibacter halelectricus TaxID=2847045 RepID=A0ABY5ZM62_9BACT|nr:CxxxxCH/CxxCH domain-containing protein [Geoalkalibacter halelectricus]UWZ79944.1 CxxxxCH/CxxCH domain-containing protein [Geoalkalibacter halelectricus]